MNEASNTFLSGIYLNWNLFLMELIWLTIFRSVFSPATAEYLSIEIYVGFKFHWCFPSSNCIKSSWKQNRNLRKAWSSTHSNAYALMKVISTTELFIWTTNFYNKSIAHHMPKYACIGKHNARTINTKTKDKMKSDRRSRPRRQLAPTNNTK